MSTRPKPPANDDREKEFAEEDAEKEFVKGLTARREATKPDDNDELSPGTTHEIVEGDDDEEPTVRRRRFSAF